jgi:hypothetical protein
LAGLTAHPPQEDSLKCPDAAGHFPPARIEVSNNCIFTSESWARQDEVKLSINTSQNVPIAWRPKEIPGLRQTGRRPGGDDRRFIKRDLRGGAGNPTSMTPAARSRGHSHCCMNGTALAFAPAADAAQTEK